MQKIKFFDEKVDFTMNNIVRNLIDICNTYDSVIMYGCGFHAICLYSVLKEWDIELEACVISKKTTENWFCDKIPVYSVSEFDVKDNRRYVVILALPQRYHKEVQENVAIKFGNKADVFAVNESEIELLEQENYICKRNRDLFLKCEISNDIVFYYTNRIRKIMAEYSRVIVQFIDLRSMGTSIAWISKVWSSRYDNKKNEYYLCYPIVMLGELELIGNNSYMIEKMDLPGIAVINRRNIDFWRYFIEHHRSFFYFQDEFQRTKEEFGLGNFAINDVSLCVKALVDNIVFSQEEIEKGSRLSEAMELHGEYVCFCIRDNAYRIKKMKWASKGFNITSRYRNAKIETCRMAMENLNRYGLKAVRMGAMAEQAVNWKNTVDYTAKYRCEFMDLYLASRCKFFMCTLGGVTTLPMLFGKPVLIVNSAFLTVRGDVTVFFHRQRDIAIVKKYWWEEKKRYLTLREMLEREVAHKYHERGSLEVCYSCEDDGIVPEDNTPDEIYDAVEEMVLRLNGTMIYDEEDEYLQKRFFNLIDSFNMGDNFPFMWRMGAKFLKRNKFLLE